MSGSPRANPFAPLNDFFDRILVLTLARSPDRQASLPDRLGGLRYELFWGTDKNDLDLAALAAEGIYSEERARRATRYRHPMSVGEVAVALSHRRIHQAALENGWERVLVLEDDVAPRRDDLAQLSAALSELPSTWELAYVGYWQREWPSAWDRAKQAAYLGLAALGVHHWTVGQVRRLYPRPHSPHLRLAGKHLGAYAYGFTRAGAAKLVAGQTPVAYPPDQLIPHLCMSGRLDAFVTEPKFFDHDWGVGGVSTR